MKNLFKLFLMPLEKAKGSISDNSDRMSPVNHTAPRRKAVFCVLFFHNCSKLNIKLPGKKRKEGTKKNFPNHNNIKIQGTMHKGNKKDHCPERKK